MPDSDRFTIHPSSDGKWLAIYDNWSDWVASVDTDDVDVTAVTETTRSIVRLLNENEVRLP